MEIYRFMRFLKLRNKTFLNVSNLEVAKCDQNAAFRALDIHPNSVLYSPKIQIIFYYRALKTPEMDRSPCADTSTYHVFLLTPSGRGDTLAQSRLLIVDLNEKCTKPPPQLMRRTL